MSETDLLVRLSADARELLAEMRRANTRYAADIDKMKAKSKEAEGAFAKLTAATGPLKGALAGLLAGASMGGMAMMVKNAVTAADEIAKAADKIGISTDALQELRYAAGLSGVEMSTLDSSLAQFNKRVAETAAGTGEARKDFAQLGIAVVDVEGRIRPTEDVLMDVADAIQAIESPAERTRVLMQLFGRSGADMANLLAGGSRSIKELGAEARRLGTVLDEKTLRAAEKAADQLDIMGKVMSTKVMATMLELMPVIDDLYGWFLKLNDAAAEFGRNWNLAKARLGLGGDDIAKLKVQAVDLYKELEKWRTTRAKTVEDMQNLQARGVGAGDPQIRGLLRMIDQYDRKIAGLENRIRNIVGTVRGLEADKQAELEKPVVRPGKLPTAPDDDEAQNRYQKVIDGLKAEQAALSMTNRERAVAAALGKLESSATPQQRAEVERLAGALWDETSARAELARQTKLQLDQMEADGNGLAESEDQHNKATLAYRASSQALDEEVASNKALIAALGVGSEAYEKQAAYLDILNRFKATGIPLDDRVIANAKELADTLGQQRDQIDSLKTAHDEQRRAAADASRVIAQGFEDAVVAGDDLRDVLKGLLQDLARIALRMTVTKPLETALTGGDKGGGLLDGIGKGIGSYFENLFSGVDYAASIPQAGMTAATGWGYHEGGVVGRDATFARSVPSSVFAHAPRYHNGGVAGLAPNEVPAILQQGEVVLPRGARMGGGGGTVNNFYMDNRGADRQGLSELKGLVLKLAGPGVVEERGVAGVIEAARRGRIRGALG